MAGCRVTARTHWVLGDKEKKYIEYGVKTRCNMTSYFVFCRTDLQNHTFGLFFRKYDVFCAFFTPIKKDNYRLFRSDPDMETPTGEITRLLESMQNGDEMAKRLLWEAVYEELQQIAHFRMRGERSGHTLSTTGLVHEAYFKLANSKRIRLKDSQHFYAFASHIMREVLIDYARKSKAQRRNNGVKPESLKLAKDIQVNNLFGKLTHDQFIDLYDALKALETLNATWAKVVEYRFFGGLNFQEIADIIGYDKRTAERYWHRARRWLYDHMNEGKGN